MRPWHAVVAALIALTSLLVLRALPYSTSFILAADEADLAQPPHEGSGQMSAWWSPALAQEASLEPFRAQFREACGDRQGLPAARCISDLLAARFPYGDPPREFVDERFHPRRHLDRHLAGMAGHCTTRSALAAALLLSSGTPARVVQILPAELPGHNVFEVYDDQAGWVLVDPSFGAVLRDADGDTPVGAVTVLRDPSRAVRWVVEGRVPDATLAEQRLPARVMRQSDLLFPEPWLYLRTGERHAPWPFRATFLRLGHGAFLHGPAQWLARFAFLLGSLTTVVSVVVLLRRRLDRRPGSERG